MKRSQPATKQYLNQEANTDDFDFVSIIDDVPLWSAPFGMTLLDTLRMRPGMNVLDVGCGLGFPLIEIAQRLGSSCKVFGIDPWERAVERARLKLKLCGIENVEIIVGTAEKAPFGDEFFDLIVSNNGINNIEDMPATLKECCRIAKPEAQLLMTMNLEETMFEFYDLFRDVLLDQGLMREVEKMQEQIYEKRKPLGEVKVLLENAGFSVADIIHDSFKIRFVDGSTMFNHSLIKYWFLGGWKGVLDPADLENVFDQLERRINRIAYERGEFNLTVPFVTIDCRKIAS